MGLDVVTLGMAKKYARDRSALIARRVTRVHGARAGLYLDGTADNYVSTPDHADLDLTGELDLVFHGRLASWQQDSPRLINKWESTGNQRSFQIRLTPGGVQVWLSTNGASPATPPATVLPLRANEEAWLRVTWKKTDGLIRVFIGKDGKTWEQVGASIAGPTTDLFNSTAPLCVGGGAAVSCMIGTLFGATVRNKIGGTIVADLALTAPVSTRVRDRAGRVWTFTGSAWSWTDDPLRLVRRGDIDSPAIDDARLIRVRGQYAYAGVSGSGGDGLAVFDISDPRNPIKVAQVGGITFGRGVTLDGNIAWVTGRDSGELAAYDITDPTAPVLLDLFTDNAILGAREVIVDGDYLYLLCGILSGIGTDGLAVFDISDPTDLTLLHRFTSTDDPDVISSGFGALDKARQAIIATDYHNTDGAPGDGITVYDISTPDAPTVRSHFTFPQLNGGRGTVRVGNVLFVASEGNHTILALDVTDLDSITLLGSVTDATLLAGARDMSLFDDTTMIVSARDLGGVTAVDVTDPAHMTIVGSLAHASMNGVYGNANDGEHIYTTSTNTGAIAVLTWE